MNSKHVETAKIFRLLGDPNRLLIVEMLRSGEKCACQLLEDLAISQSTLSYHMKSLCELDVVHCRPEGKWVYYSLNKEGWETAYNLLAGIMAAPTDSHVSEKCTCE